MLVSKTAVFLYYILGNQFDGWKVKNLWYINVIYILYIYNTPPPPPFQGTNKRSGVIKSVHIYRKYAKCAETNEKPILQFLQILVLEMWSCFGQNWSIFRWILSTKSSITQKICIAKFGKLIFHSFQIIVHLFCKYDYFIHPEIHHFTLHHCVHLS